MYYKRELEEILIKSLSQKEITAVIGPRQSGKTTTLKHILSKFENVNMLTFDDVGILQLFNNDIKSFIDLHITNYDYVFIDEIQYAKDSGKNLKFIYDTTSTKLVVSGSSAAEISIQSLRYLVGRIFVFTLFPFSFQEFLSAKKPELLQIYTKGEYGHEIEVMLAEQLETFLEYGGYPRVVLAEDNEQKKTVLKNIYNILILREVKDLFGITETEKLSNFIRVLALQTGNLLNYSELSGLTGINYKQLKNYFKILEETYIAKRCYSFSKNKRTEITKTPKIYFYDYGLRNTILNNFNSQRTDKGAVYENLIFTELLKNGKELNYWRTKSGAEVDFILNEEPIEIKTTPRTIRSFFSFINKYNPQNGYIISEKGAEPKIENGCKINFVTFTKFLA